MSTTTKFFTEDWKETTPENSFYVVILEHDKDGKLISSKTGIRAPKEEEKDGKGALEAGGR
jgi:hypothetical protein